MAAIWTTQRERGSPAFLSLFTWIALRMGRPVARLLLYPIAWYFVFAGGAARAASRDYIKRVLGRDATLADGFRHVHCFASAILDRLYFLNDRHDLFDIEVIGRDIVREAMKDRPDARACASTRTRGATRGAFLIGAHLGSFEAIRAAGHEETDLRVSMVMYQDNVQQLHRILAAINPRHSQSIIALGRVDSMLRVKQALDDGEFVGMLADRTLAEEVGGNAVREMTLLGDRVTIPIGPFRMAAMLKRPVIFIVGLYRGGNRYEVHYENLFDFSHESLASGADRAATMNQAIDTAIERYVERLEHHCKSAPFNWFNFYDYWNDAERAGTHQAEHRGSQGP
ncbi:MAG: acyl-CoA synthetase [Burkholderiaceae bacterium]